MAKIGHIKLHRGWEDSDFFQDEETYCERAAWAWLLSNAAWKEGVRSGPKGAVVNVRPGQFHTSLRTLGKAWGWDKNRVSRFIRRATACKMIVTEAGQSGILITVVKWAEYQGKSEPEGQSRDGLRDGLRDSRGTVEGQSRDTQEEGKEGKEGKEGYSVSNDTDDKPSIEVVEVDPIKLLFDEGVTLLTGADVGAAQARSWIGKERKRHGDGRVLQAVRAARDGAVSAPIPWMTKWLANNGEAGEADRRRALLAQADRYAAGGAR